MKIINLSKILLPLISITFFIGCGSDYESEIIGKWKDKNSNVVVFSEDGVVKGLARNVNKELVEGTYKVNNDSLFIEFLVAPEPRNITGSLEFKIQKLNGDSLILYTSLGNLNYGRLTK
ncbi:MAG: hypothetical protein KJO12_11035 [Ignavibacteria bacterium]|nr:hypothetical protein [Ignavibacteria bacterium]